MKKKELLKLINNELLEYRDVMIFFYLEGLSTAEIAKLQNTSETAIRQRLFSARKKIKDEVAEMEKVNNKPVALSNIDYVIWGKRLGYLRHQRMGWVLRVVGWL